MSDLPVPDGVLLYYNGYTFGVETEMVRVDVRPNWDSAGRTVISTTNTFTFKTKIVDTGILGLNTSSAIADIKRRLSQPAGWFKMTGFGYGDMSVNNPDLSGLRDLKWGPKPLVESWEQIGSDQAWGLVWRVEITILDQCDTATYRGQPMEFNYKIGITVDRSGYTTRNYIGHISVPNTRLRVGDRSLIDNPDRYLEEVLPPVPHGFRREPRPHEISEDKSSMTFSVTDTELRGYSPPPDVVFSRVTHSIRSDQKGFIKWIGTVSASYEMLKTVPKSRAWNLFWNLARDRMDNAWKYVKANNTGNGLVLPLSFSASGGDLHSSDAGTFNLTFLLTLSMDTKKAKKTPGGALADATKVLPDAAGLWLVPPGSDYTEWSKSMIKGQAWSPRGYAGLTFANTDDRIVDLCAGSKKVIAAAGDNDSKLPRKRAGKITVVDADGGEREPYNIFKPEKPKPGKSWIDYEQRLVFEQRDTRSVLVPLPAQPVGYVPPSGDIGATTGLSTGYRTTSKLIIQTRAAPILHVRLVGRAVRAGYEITPPTVSRIGGVEAIPDNDGSDTLDQWVIGNLGVPVIAATWSRRYVLASPPLIGLTVPLDPLQGGISNDGLEGLTVQG